MASDQRLFVETSAVVLNAMGRREVRDGIREATRPSRLMSSRFVLLEFEAVLSGLYDRLRGRLLANLEPDRPDTAIEILRQATDGLPPVLPGGYSMIADLSAHVGARFSKRNVTPRQLANWLEGERVAVELSGLRFEQGDLRQCAVLIDNHSCCVFQESSSCGADPGAGCRLKWLCDSQRGDFMEAVGYLAGSAREEAKWLRKNFERVGTAVGRSLLKLVAAHVGHFGDVIIFLGVPDGATILTRDATFELLRQKSARPVRIWTVRAPRRPCNVSAVAVDALKNQRSVGTITNLTSRDCLLVAENQIASKNHTVIVEAKEINVLATGKLLRVTRVGDRFEHGIRFMSPVQRGTPRRSQ